MELKEAFDTIDATLGMFRSIEEEVENGDLKDKFLLTPVYSSVENVFDVDKNEIGTEVKSYYNYVEGERESKRYIVDIRPVCSYLVNERPSYRAKRIRKKLIAVTSECANYCEISLGGIADVAEDEGFSYDRYMRTQESRDIGTVMLDTIHEMCHALRLTEEEELDAQEEQIYINDDRIVTEEMAKQMDWAKVTKNYNPDAIKDLVKNIGKSKREKKIIIEAIYDAMTHSGELARIPYRVDRLLDDLYRAYDENHKGVFEAYDEKRESLNLDTLMRGAIEEYMEKHTATDADIDELFNSASTIQEIDKHPVVLDNVPKEFKNDEAKELMHKLSCAGLVSDDWQPIDLSIAERGYLAGEIASRLKIKNKWIVLGKLWGQKPETLRQGNNKATGQAKTGLFIEKLKRILG